DVYNLPFNEAFIENLKPDTRYLNGAEGEPGAAKPGTFFRGTFDLVDPADTFIDLTNYQKGIAWVNGHNLGRYWNIGPQFRLYCPAPWLKKGKNEVMVFDLHQIEAKSLAGKRTMD
ncbi:MAG: beta-galactosidase, partial [Porphyromonadaceae bacterium]